MYEKTNVQKLLYNQSEVTTCYSSLLSKENDPEGFLIEGATVLIGNYKNWLIQVVLCVKLS